MSLVPQLLIKAHGNVFHLIQDESRYIQPPTVQSCHVTIKVSYDSRILPIVISIVSCTPLNSCYELKPLLLSCLTCFQVASKSLESLLNDSYYEQHTNTDQSTQENHPTTYYLLVHKNIILLNREI